MAEMQWKVSGLPESPGKGYRWIQEIRKVTFQERYWNGNGVGRWTSHDPSESLFPIVEKITPKRIVLEQVLGESPIAYGDVSLLINEKGNIYCAAAVCETQKFEKAAEMGCVWRIVEDES